MTRHHANQSRFILRNFGRPKYRRAMDSEINMVSFSPRQHIHIKPRRAGTSACE